MRLLLRHYSDVIMGAMASQITSRTIVDSTVYSGADQRKNQSSASLAFVRGIHRWPANSPHNGQQRGKCFLLMTSSWLNSFAILPWRNPLFMWFLGSYVTAIKVQAMQMLWEITMTSSTVRLPQLTGKSIVSSKTFRVRNKEYIIVSLDKWINKHVRFLSVNGTCWPVTITQY